MPGFELIGEEEKEAVLDVFESSNGVLFRHGFDEQRNGRYRVKEFQQRFADYLGVEHALAVTSGTAAVKVALEALDVGPGDEVVTQSFTFVATVEAILECGATPVIANVNDTLNMDPADLAEKLTPRTKAVMPVHMLGVAAEMDAIREVADDAGVPVVEENCESLGARYSGRCLGSLGDIAAHSFDFGKVMTTGEGGMVATDDPELHALTEEYHDHGHENNPDFPRGKDTRRIPGFNFRMTELQAAVGLAQLDKLDYIREVNRRNYGYLAEAVGDLDGIELRRVPEPCEPLCDTLIFYLPTEERAAAYVEALGERGLYTKNIPDALDWHFAGRWGYLAEHLGTTEKELAEATEPSRELLARSVSIPVWVDESKAEVRERAATLREIASEVL